MIQRKDGGWLFISHAHEDIEQVRKIRNYLEEEGFNPIVFFLKSKTNRWLLDRLIKKEIRARKWFILVDSPASRSSYWVRREYEYAHKQADRIRLKVDLKKEVIPQLKGIVSRTRVILTYARCDAEIANCIRDKLIQNDFQVWCNCEDMTMVDSCTNAFSALIDNTVREGLFLLLITESAQNNNSLLRELERMIEFECHFVPVIIGNVGLTAKWRYYFDFYGTTEAIHMWHGLTEGSLNRLVEDIIAFQERDTL